MPLRQTTWNVTSISAVGVRLNVTVPEASEARVPMNPLVGVTVKPVPSGITWTPEAAFGRGFPTRTVISAVRDSEKASGLSTTDTLSGVFSTWTGTG